MDLTLGRKNQRKQQSYWSEQIYLKTQTFDALTSGILVDKNNNWRKIWRY